MDYNYHLACYRSRSGTALLQFLERLPKSNGISIDELQSIMSVFGFHCPIQLFKDRQRLTLDEVCRLLPVLTSTAMAIPRPPGRRLPIFSGSYSTRYSHDPFDLPYSWQINTHGQKAPPLHRPQTTTRTRTPIRKSIVILDRDENMKLWSELTLLDRECVGFIPLKGFVECLARYNIERGLIGELANQYKVKDQDIVDHIAFLTQYLPYSSNI